MMEQNPYVAIEQLRQDVERLKRAQTNSLLPANGRATGAVPTLDNTGAVAWSDRGTTDASLAAVSFATGWANLGGGYAAVRYRRVDGNLYITGVAAKANIAGSTTLMFTLPLGFRPASNHIVPTLAMVSGIINDAHIYIAANGNAALEETGLVASTVVNYAPINICIPLA